MQFAVKHKTNKQLELVQDYDKVTKKSHAIFMYRTELPEEQLISV